MEEDVSRAIKQLESIAIKAMKSGYLDDAAKVMHIAEEIERVDKSGAGVDAVDTSATDSSNKCAHIAEPSAIDQSNVQPPFASLDVSPADRCRGSTDANVISLNRFRMKRPTTFEEVKESQERS